APLLDGRGLVEERRSLGSGRFRWPAVFAIFLSLSWAALSRVQTSRNFFLDGTSPPGAALPRPEPSHRIRWEFCRLNRGTGLAQRAPEIGRTKVMKKVLDRKSVV